MEYGEAPAHILDAHFDLLLNVREARAQGETHVLERKFLPGFRAAGIQVQICSLFIRDMYYPEMATRNALDQISYLYEDLEECGHSFALCTNTEQIDRAVLEGKIALLLSLEGAEPLGQDLALLRVFYELGVRLLGIVWSRRNHAGDGAFFAARREAHQSRIILHFVVDLVFCSKTHSRPIHPKINGGTVGDILIFAGQGV